MLRAIIDTLPDVIKNRIVWIRRQYVNFRTLAKEYGQYKSIKLFSAVDKNGKPIPWYTYPAIEYLSQFKYTEMKVFEYGSGNSSLFWAERCHSIISVEHNKEWFDQINKTTLPNQIILLAEDKESYIKSLEESGEIFDLIIIDGIHRQDCARNIAGHLNKEGGIVILDNSDWYAATAKYLRETFDFIQVDFHGFSPINAYTLTTSVFLSRNVRLTPINNQPEYSVAAIREAYEH